MLQRARSFAPVVALLLGGCGLALPNMREFYETPKHEEADENIIINQIKCELHKGVQDTLNDPRFAPQTPTSGNSVGWLRQWGAKVTFALTVDEKGALNPGVTVTEPFANSILKFPNGNVTTGQSFSLGMGVQASADATRKETIGVAYSFDELLNEKPITQPCSNEDGVLIHSDLKIGEFISNKAFIARVPGTAGPEATAGPFNVFSYEATFVVVYGGSVTPSWKFVRVSANPTAPFLNATRTRTQYVTITLGPVTGKTNPPTFSPDVNDVHSSTLIGHAVATSIQSQQP